MTLVSLASGIHHTIVPWVVLYIGPEAFLPLTSVIVATAGAVMIFWNRLVGFARKLRQMVSRRSD